jgi:cytochrome c oxidase subunit I
VLWVLPLSFVLGAVLVLGLRLAMGFESAGFGALVPDRDFLSVPAAELQVLITVWTVVCPFAFLAALGGFDYWAHWVSGRPTRPEDHSGHGARTWKDYFRVNTDHKVIGIQYLVTTIFFFVAAGLMAMFMRAELARPGMQFVDNNEFNGLFSVHATLMIFLFVIPAFAGLGNYVIPLMIGAPDMAFPRLNALSYWLLPIAGFMMLSSSRTAAPSPPGGRTTCPWPCSSRWGTFSSRWEFSGRARRRS